MADFLFLKISSPKNAGEWPPGVEGKISPARGERCFLYSWGPMDTDSLQHGAKQGHRYLKRYTDHGSGVEK